MSDYLFQYRGIDPTTWVYLSSLLLIGLFFKFGRLWSVRNLDLILLILLGPGLLMVHHGQSEQGRLLQNAQAQQVEVLATNEAANENTTNEIAATGPGVSDPIAIADAPTNPTKDAAESPSPRTQLRPSPMRQRRPVTRNRTLNHQTRRQLPAKASLRNGSSWKFGALSTYSASVGSF